MPEPHVRHQVLAFAADANGAVSFHTPELSATASCDGIVYPGTIVGRDRRRGQCLEGRDTH